MKDALNHTTKRTCCNPVAAIAERECLKVTSVALSVTLCKFSYTYSPLYVLLQGFVHHKHTEYFKC